jgi:hypothetical protein
MEVLLIIYLIGIAVSFILQMILIHRYKADKLYCSEKRSMQIIAFFAVLIFWPIFAVSFIHDKIKEWKKK